MINIFPFFPVMSPTVTLMLLKCDSHPTLVLPGTLLTNAANAIIKFFFSPFPLKLHIPMTHFFLFCLIKYNFEAL